MWSLQTLRANGVCSPLSVSSMFWWVMMFLERYKLLLVVMFSFALYGYKILWYKMKYQWQRIDFNFFFLIFWHGLEANDFDILNFHVLMTYYLWNRTTRKHWVSLAKCDLFLFCMCRPIRRRGGQRMRWWITSLTQWTWVWANSWRQWRSRKPDVLQFMGSQRIGHNLVTEQSSILPHLE